MQQDTEGQPHYLFFYTQLSPHLLRKSLAEEPSLDFAFSTGYTQLVGRILPDSPKQFSEQAQVTIVISIIEHARRKG